jgi:hypothetical protein
MATIPYTLETAVLTAGVLAYVTAPVATYLTTKKVTVTNTTGAPVTFTLYKVSAAGAPSAANLLVGALTIPANTVNGGVKEIYEAENQILYPGDTLQAFASAAASLNLNVSGILQTT